jgi:hypothetical protein
MSSENQQPAAADQPVTIIKGGDQAVRVPRDIMEAHWIIPPSAREWKTFIGLLWCADREEYWEAAAAALDESVRSAPLRIEAAAIRDAAGYAADHDLNGLFQALDGLAQSQLVDLEQALDGLAQNQLVNLETQKTFPLLAYRPIHGRRWVDIWFGADIIDCHREIQEYALVNLNHVQALRTPLDCLVYNEATLVAKRRNPRFGLNVSGAAFRGRIAQGRGWAAFGRPFRQALQRVANTTGARFTCYAYSTGNLPGIDTVKVHVSHVATPHKSRFRKTHRRHRREFVIEGDVAVEDAPRSAVAAPMPAPLVAQTASLLAAVPTPTGNAVSPAAQTTEPVPVSDIPF